MNKISVGSMMKRREVLGFLGGTVAVSVVGCLRDQSASGTPNQTLAQTPAGTKAPACVIKPQQTEGPYFVDEKLNRSDIRSNPADGAVKPGVPLRLMFQVSQVGADSCTPLKGAIVDIWHCDASGAYSDVSERSFSTVGQKFLRGYQVTDAWGKVEFLTIYPGWYEGRTVHIHFKIRTDAASSQRHEFTSQLYFDDAISDQVCARSPYAAKGQRTQKNDSDGIFQDGGEQLLLQLSQDSTGYVGTFDLGLDLSTT